MHTPITIEANNDHLLVRRPPDVQPATWRSIKTATVAHLDALVAQLRSER